MVFISEVQRSPAKSGIFPGALFEAQKTTANFFRSQTNFFNYLTAFWSFSGLFLDQSIHFASIHHCFVTSLVFFDALRVFSMFLCLFSHKRVMFGRFLPIFDFLPFLDMCCHIVRCLACLAQMSEKKTQKFCFFDEGWCFRRVGYNSSGLHCILIFARTCRLNFVAQPTPKATTTTTTT